MQLVGLLLSRKENLFNVFSGINAKFVIFWIVILGLQCLLVQYGGVAMRMVPLWGADMTTDSLFFAGFIAAVVFVWGMLLKCLPVTWFGKSITANDV